MEANQLTAEELAAIRERESKATPGPWTKDADPTDVVIWDPGEEFVCNVGARVQPASVAFDSDSNDGDFIAAARTDIPRLLATVEALRAENERLRVIVHHAAEAARERRYQRLIEHHDAPTNMMRSRDAEAKEIGMALALAVAYEEPEA